MKDPQDEGIFNQARDLYNQLSSEARRKVEADRRAARRKGPLTRALWGTCVLACVIAAATLLYGFIAFPDAPVRQTASGYAGKHGAPHTLDDYERFKLWEKLLFASFGLAMLTGVGAVVSEKVSQRRDTHMAGR